MCVCVCVCVCVCMCAFLVSQSCQTLWTPWTVARQAPLSMGILLAGILEWFAMPSSRDLPNPGNWTGISSTKGFPCGSASKEFACNAGDLDLIPGLGRPPGEGKGYPHQYSGLENSMNSLRVRHDWATFTFTPALQADSLPFEPPNGGL